MSKGKIYKRPPMMLLQKQPVKLSWRNVKEQVKQEKPEKAEKPEQLSLEKIDAVLTECLKLAEEVGMEKEVLEQAREPPQQPGVSEQASYSFGCSCQRGNTRCGRRKALEMEVGRRQAAKCANREKGARPRPGACACHRPCPGTWQQEFLQQQPRLTEPP